MLRSNWISSLGALIVTCAIVAELFALVMQGSQTWEGPYIGLLTVIGLPALMVLGLLLIPLGLFLYRKQLKARLAAMADRPMHTARAVVVITLLNLVGIGTAGNSAVQYMNSEQFCGKACHEVMQPEYDTYLESPHSNIGCVTCHVGPGAEGFIKAKLNGTRQLISTLRDNYQRPIPAPVHDLPSTHDICLKCHSARRFLGTKLVVRSRYEQNEKSTGITNVLLLRRGGESPDGRVQGIHWHAHPDAKVDFFAADPQRTEIPWIRVVKPDGTEKTFRTEGYTETPGDPSLRRMDCVDCHNRVGHPFETAEHAVDTAMASGLVTRDLPFMKKHAVEALQKGWSRETAHEEIGKSLKARYAEAGLDAEQQAKLAASVEVLAERWLRNNFPKRKLTWNSYPDFKSHDGCFRCHDGKHRDESGNVLSNACKMCHVVLSEKQENPAILNTLGIQQKK